MGLCSSKIDVQDLWNLSLFWFTAVVLTVLPIPLATGDSRGMRSALYGITLIFTPTWSTSTVWKQ